jgi:hypothetical protein
MTDKRYDSLKEGQTIYWRWRKDGKGWKYATVCLNDDCASLIDLRYDDSIGGVSWTVVDPNDIDYRECKS